MSANPEAAARAPAGLAGWEALIATTDLDFVTAIAPWLPRLRAALGTLKSPLTEGDGAPDGLDGLSRRGPYERLLMTEWLLAEEAPDEFLRRAISGEHAFLALARKTPRAERRVVALLDAGPDQLGTPRVAQLVILHALWRRALEGGARLEWGTVQRPCDPLTEGIGSAAHAVFRAAAHPDVPTEQHLAYWRVRLEDPAELWLIGGQGLGRFAKGSDAQITLAEPLFEAGLSVQIQQASGIRRIALQAVPVAQLKAALRRPAPVRAPTASSHPQRMTHQRSTTELLPIQPHLRYNPTGQRLFALTTRGDLLGFHAPNSRFGKAGRTTWIRRAEGLLLAGLAQPRRRYDTLELLPNGNLAVQTHDGGRAEVEIHASYPVSLPNGPALLTRLPSRRLLFVDAENVQYLVDAAKRSFSMPAQGGLYHPDIQRGRLWYFSGNAAPVLVGPTGSEDKLNAHIASAPGPDESPLIGFGGPIAEWGPLAIATQPSPSRWTIYTGSRTVHIECGAEVIGVIGDRTSHTAEPGLLTRISPTQLGFVRAAGPERLPEQDGTIGPVAVSWAHAQIAYCVLDAQHRPIRLVIWDIAEGIELLSRPIPVDP